MGYVYEKEIVQSFRGVDLINMIYMNEDIKQIMVEHSREDLIEIHELNQSGYAGINPNGNIVDRREFPKATPIPENKMFGIPKPKDL